MEINKNKWGGKTCTDKPWISVSKNSGKLLHVRSISFKNMILDMGSISSRKHEMILWTFETLEPRNQETSKPRSVETRNFETKNPRNFETKKPSKFETKKLWNQEAKKLWNQETLKPRNQETNKPFYFQKRESPTPATFRRGFVDFRISLFLLKGM